MKKMLYLMKLQISDAVTGKGITAKLNDEVIHALGTVNYMKTHLRYNQAVEEEMSRLENEAKTVMIVSEGET
jgi:cation transport ATPase